MIFAVIWWSLRIHGDYQSKQENWHDIQLKYPDCPDVKNMLSLSLKS